MPTSFSCANCKGKCTFHSLLSDIEASSYLGKLVNINYKKKENIIKQNSHASHIVFVNKGLAKVFTERRNDKNIILNIVSSGSFIGLSDLYNDTYNYSVVALKESNVCLIPKVGFIELINQNLSLARYFLIIQSKYHSYMVNKLSSLGTKQMHGRLADVILYLNKEELNNDDIYGYITRKEISELSGMSPESAIRLLTEFKNDGLIRFEGKKIVINNMELLTRLSEIG